MKNWQNGTMALRWCAAGMIEARGQFRRVNGPLHLPARRAALNAHVAAQTVGAVRQDDSGLPPTGKAYARQFHAAPMESR